MKNLVIIIFFLIFSCTKDSNNSTGPCTENCAIPAWDNDGDGVLDNYSDYQNNGSITIAVFLNEENSATGGDMLAVFEDEIQIGVGSLELVPFGPYIGTNQFLTLIYGNQVSNKFLVFQFYDIETDQIYELEKQWAADAYNANCNCPIA